jgi:uncharacterized membrane protein
MVFNDIFNNISVLGVRYIGGSSRFRVKPKTMQMAFAAARLRLVSTTKEQEQRLEWNQDNV